MLSVTINGCWFSYQNKTTTKKDMKFQMEAKAFMIINVNYFLEH